MRPRLKSALANVLCTVVISVFPSPPAHADRIRHDQWHLDFLHVAEAHGISQGEGIIVAVIDTGVDPHPDLRDNLLSGTDVVPGGTGDGRQDEIGHGTAMAGLIAAHGQGSMRGALGLAPKAKILPIRQQVTEGPGDSDNVAAGIEWAIAHDAKIVSISWAGGPSPRLSEAVRDAVKRNVLVIAGAGNHPPFYGVAFPALLDGVVAVGATDRKGNHAAISVTGKKVEISAPGVDIYSTSYRGKYYKGTGTSASTAIVAGAAALVWSRFPNLSAQEVMHRLTATATDKGKPGRDEEYGYGVLNLVAALTADVPPLDGGPLVSATPAPSPTTGLAAPDSGPHGFFTDRPRALLITLTVAGIVLLAVAVATLAIRRRRV